MNILMEKGQGWILDEIENKIENPSERSSMVINEPLTLNTDLVES